MVVGVYVESENIQTGEKKHCNSSYFTMVAKDEKGVGAIIPGLIILNDEELRRYTRSLVRKEEAKNRDNRFSSEGFNKVNALKEIEGQNFKFED
jgi:acyl-CoA hydrolase